MKFNKLSSIPMNGVFDESDDLLNPNRNSMLRTVVLTIGAIIAIIFLITCFSVYVTGDTDSVLYALIAVILQRAIQGTIESYYGMKATAMNTYLWGFGAIAFGLLLFPFPVK